MREQHLTPLERATAIAERDQLHPFQGIRHDTGEPIWLVQSRSDPSRYYLLTVSSEKICCPCPQAQYRGICAHAAAVRLAIQAKQHHISPAYPAPTQPASSSILPSQHRSVSQQEQERLRRAEAERRERALLWTDDRPFSIYK